MTTHRATDAADLSDESLYAHFRDQGDQGCLDALLARHRSSLISFAGMYTGQRTQAEDAFQNACLALVQKPEAFNEERGCFLPWFRSVIIKQAQRLQREEGRRKRREAVASTDFPDRDSETQEAEAEEADTIGLRTSVAELPVKYAEVLHLFYFEGMSAPEIAEKLSANPSTVRSHLHRGIKQLRSRLSRVGSLLLLLIFLSERAIASCLPSGASAWLRRHVWSKGLNGIIFQTRVILGVFVVASLSVGALIMAQIINYPLQNTAQESTNNEVTAQNTLHPTISQPESKSASTGQEATPPGLPVKAIEHGWMTLPDAIAAWNWRHRQGPSTLLFTCALKIQSLSPVYVSRDKLSEPDARSFAEHLADLHMLELIWKHEVAFFSSPQKNISDDPYTQLASGDLTQFAKALNILSQHSTPLPEHILNRLDTPIDSPEFASDPRYRTPAPAGVALNPLDWTSRHRLYRVPLILFIADASDISHQIQESQNKGPMHTTWAENLARVATEGLNDQLNRRSREAREQQARLARSYLTSNSAPAERTAALDTIGLCLTTSQDMDIEASLRDPVLLLRHASLSAEHNELIAILSDHELSNEQTIALGLCKNLKIRPILERQTTFAGPLALSLSHAVYRQDSNKFPHIFMTKKSWSEAHLYIMSPENPWQLRQIALIGWLSLVARQNPLQREQLMQDLEDAVHTDTDPYGLRLLGWVKSHLNPQYRDQPDRQGLDSAF